MPSTTITITDVAYEALKSEKQAGESFTEAVLRLTRRPSLRTLADALTPRESAALAEAHLEAKRERRPRREGEVGADVDARAFSSRETPDSPDLRSGSRDPSGRERTASGGRGAAGGGAGVRGR